MDSKSPLSLFFLAPNYLFVPPHVAVLLSEKEPSQVCERKDFPLFVFNISLFLLFFMSLTKAIHTVQMQRSSMGQDRDWTYSSVSPPEDPPLRRRLHSLLSAQSAN